MSDCNYSEDGENSSHELAFLKGSLSSKIKQQPNQFNWNRKSTADTTK